MATSALSGNRVAVSKSPTGPRLNPPAPGMNRRSLCRAPVWVGLLLLFFAQAQAADIVIVNQDGPGEGLNDPRLRAPTGSNQGSTLGEQRRNAIRYATAILGSRLQSTVPIRVAVRFDPLPCGDNNGILAFGGAKFLVSDFPGAIPETFYPIALANAIAGERLRSPGADIGADIVVTFNSRLDNEPACLAGMDWYYGLDNNPASGDLSFLSTAVHELIHGLGFATFMILDPRNGQVGTFPETADGQHLPDVFTREIQDLSIPGQPLWPDLTRAQRTESATNGPDVVWSGDSTMSAAGILRRGVNQGRVQLYAPATILAGSSISHWDIALEPDAIMEPFATGDDNVVDGLGLATCVFQDIGWRLAPGTRCPDTDSEAVIGPVDVTVESPNAANDSGGSGGGGCTMRANAKFDPLLPLLVFTALGVLGWRRRTGRA